MLAHLKSKLSKCCMESMLDTLVDDMPFVPVLAHLKRKLSKPWLEGRSKGCLR